MYAIRSYYALLDYRNHSAAGVRAHPSEEHLLPLYFAIGAAGEQWTTHQRLSGQIDYSVIAMDSWILGGSDYPLAA